MCFTGGYALAMAADPVLLAPVLSQPSAPFAVSKRRKETIDISPSDLAAVQQRCAHEDLTVLGLRFKGDRFVPAERFEFLREQLGDAFVAIELDDDAANPDAIMSPHSVVTEHLIDDPGQPTRATPSIVSSICSGRDFSESHSHGPIMIATGAVGRILTSRGIRGFADGFVSVLLAQYLDALGFSPFEVGAIVTGTLLGSAALTLTFGLTAHRYQLRTLLVAASAAHGRDRPRLHDLHVVLAVARRRGAGDAQPLGR